MLSIWVDASFRDGIAGIAAVTESGKVLGSGTLNLKSAHEGECAAIMYAKQIIQEQGLAPATIFTDSTSAAHPSNNGRKMPGVTVKWKGRKHNLAHDEARRLLLTKVSGPDPTSGRTGKKRKSLREEVATQFGPGRKLEEFWQRMDQRDREQRRGGS